MVFSSYLAPCGQADREEPVFHYHPCLSALLTLEDPFQTGAPVTKMLRMLLLRPNHASMRGTKWDMTIFEDCHNNFFPMKIVPNVSRRRGADKHFNRVVTCYVIHAESYMFVIRIHFLERQKIRSSKRFTVGFISRT